MKKILLGFFLILFFLTPFLVFAGTIDTRHDCPTGLVPCGGPDCACNLCDFFVMIQRIVTFVLTEAVPVLAVLMVVVAGVMMIAAYAGQAGPELVNQSKKLLLSIAVGLIVVYGAWVIVNLFLSTIRVESWTGLDNWWVINCETFGLPPTIPPIPQIPPIPRGEGFCGDGMIQSPNGDGVNEVCDGASLGDHNCHTEFGFPEGSTGLKCLVCVGFDPSGCAAPPPIGRGVCGDNTINSPNGLGIFELCDGTALGTATCADYGFTAAATGLKCATGSCTTWDWSGCKEPEPPPPAQICGNNKKEGTEVCDGTDVGAKTCVDFGMGPGTLICLDGSNCQQFDPSNCGPIIPPESGDKFHNNCSYPSFPATGAGARMINSAPTDPPPPAIPTKVFLTGGWSINKISSQSVIDGVTHWYTDCQLSGLADEKGWKDLAAFASTHPDGDYIAYSSDTESFLFFKIRGGVIVP